MPCRRTGAVLAFVIVKYATAEPLPGNGAKTRNSLTSTGAPESGAHARQADREQQGFRQLIDLSLSR